MAVRLKMDISVFIFAAFFLGSSISTGPDNQGTEFILAFMENRFMGSQTDLELFLTTVVNDPVSVNITAPLYSASVSHSITVTRGNVEKVTLPYAMRGDGTELTGKTAWVVASDEVVVYVVNKEQYSTDAYVAIPTDALGQEYYAMTFYEETEMAIVGIVDGTSVSITFPTPQYGSISVTYNGVTYSDTDTLNVTMNRFQTFHLFQDSGTKPDFTGTYIQADQPISVISGNKKVPVPSGSSSDHLTEALFPLECWGREFYSYSTPDRGRGDVFRILASVDGTTVTVNSTHNGVFTISLNAGQYEELDVDTGDIMTITADNGIKVGVFSKTFANDGPNYGDPAFSFLIPQPLFASDYTYSTIKLPNGNDFNNKLTLTIRDSDKDGLRLDENTISVTWSNLPGSDYVTGWLYVSAGTHNVYHVDPSKTFMALATGTEEYNSYAFASGMRLTQINRPCTTSTPSEGDILDNDCDGQIDEELENGLDDDGDGQIDEDFSLGPRVNGNWGEWGNWSACSVTCIVNGARSRTRACDNPAAANNGLDCSGDSSETEVCDNTNIPCGVWGDWAEWSACSVTCNDGVRSRDRNCTDVVTSLPDTCIGDYNETEGCDVGPIQGVCHANVSGVCTCDWGYDGNNCELCVGNYTGCYCEYCEDNLIGHDTNCSTPCYNGYASVSGGDQCECYENTTLGFWQNNVCTACLTGYSSPDCLTCDTGWVGTDDHCSIPCANGSHAYDWDGTTGNDDIVPQFTCAVNASSSVLAWFGYSSFNSRVVTIATGPDNNVNGSDANSQTTEFRPGLHQYAFSVGPFTLGAINVTWTLTVNAASTNHSVSVPDVPTWCSGTAALDNLAEVNTSADIGYCKCDSGIYGASCTYECPGGASSPCSNRGVCRKTDGYCICQSRWTSVIYDYNLYDEGYRDPDPAYTCDICSQDWYGTDCSTALLNRTNYNMSTAGDSSDHHSAVSTSAIITLDGASLELVKPGAYRLLQMAGITMDGYFQPCQGRYDCHSLTEVALNVYDARASVAIDNTNGQLVLNSTLGSDTSSAFSLTEGNVTLAYTVATNTIRLSVLDGPSVVVANIQGGLILGLSVPANTSGVSGLLGNADGDWVNDVASGASTASYSASDLEASNKAENADNNFEVTSSNSILVQSDPDAGTGSGGYAMFLNSSTTANVTGLPLVELTAFTIEFWLKLPDASAAQTELVALETDLGVASFYTTSSGALAASWGGVFTSGLTMPSDQWIYVAITWDGGVDGNLTLHKIPVGSADEERSTGHQGNSTVQTASSLQLGAGLGTSAYMDYIRVFDKVRTATEMRSDFTSYSDEFIDNQVLLILLDEGGTSTMFSARSYFRDIAGTHMGTVGGAWFASDCPVSDVSTMDQLDAVVTDLAAISACRAELENSAFTAHCSGFGAMKQLLLENCISDYSRASLASDVDASAIVKLAGSAFAFYCQGVTQTDQCQFAGYLDFCPSQASSETPAASAASSGGGMLFAIAGAVAGLAIIAAIIAACCCCCPKALCGRKKIFDSSSEEEEEEEEELEEEEMPPVQDATSTTALDTAGLKTAAGAGMVAGVALTMRTPGKMSLGEEKPFEPLHKGRWTPYGWLPGARPVEGVSTMAPDEMGVDQYGNPVEEGGAPEGAERPMTAQRPPTATHLPRPAAPPAVPAAPSSSLGPAMSPPAVGSVPPPAPQPSLEGPQLSRGAPSQLSMAGSRTNTVSSIAISLDSCDGAMDSMAPVEPTSKA